MASCWSFQPGAPIYALVPYVCGPPAVAAPASWPCIQLGITLGLPAAATQAAALPRASAPVLVPAAPPPAPAPAAGMTIRIVLHGCGEQGAWTRVADMSWHQDQPDAAAVLRAGVAHAKRAHFPPTAVGRGRGGGRLRRNVDAADHVPSTLNLWTLRRGAPLRMLPGSAGGGPVADPDVLELLLDVRPDVPDDDGDDEGRAAEAATVREVLEQARAGGLGVFLLVNMDGDDTLGVPGDRGRTIGPP